LPPRQRAVVVLRYWEDLTDTQIGATLGCSPGTVRSQLSRALAKLREDPALEEGDERWADQATRNCDRASANCSRRSSRR
jgi:DNA-directed RNA polymerase specialized sigma24 family protein